MSSLDYHLFYDEDQDIESDEMSDWTPVQPSHMVELYERGLVKHGEVFSHKGWHHCIRLTEGIYRAQMWDSALDVGEHWWNSQRDRNYDEWS